MHSTSPSGRPVAFALVALLLATPLAGAASVRSVGEIFVDAQGRLTGANLGGRITEAEAVLEGFSALALGTTVFQGITIEGFEAREKIVGVGSSALTLRGSNAIVSLHDNLHSTLKISATQPTTIVYALAPGLSASPSPEHRGIVNLHHTARGHVGSLVAYGVEGPQTRGEVLQVKGSQVLARAQSGSEILFLARGGASTYQDALVSALAEGTLASHFITELEGSSVASSQVDAGQGSVARTQADAAGAVSTALSSRPSGPTLLVYDLAYETLPARSADEVAVFIDGELAPRAAALADVLARAREGAPGYAATSEGGRTRVLVSSPAGGEHRVVVAASASAGASRESQARAENDGDEGARASGGFEYHSNGKLTGEFLTSVIPQGQARLLSFTQLATRTEVFRSVSVDGGASAAIHPRGADRMVLESTKATLTLVDDLHATTLVEARAPVEATFELATDVRAEAQGARIVALVGPQGPAGSLVHVGETGSLVLDGQGHVRARLAPGERLIYRGVADEHASEPAVVRALAEGRLGAQLVAGAHEGALATGATPYFAGVDAAARAAGRGAIEVAYTAGQGAPRAFALDARGAALVAKSAADVRVLVEGEPLAPSATPEDVLDAAGVPRYFASTTPDGALRILVHVAGAAEQAVHVTIESLVAESAKAQARTDAFGAFRLFHDGAAVGSFVTLQADRALGAASGFTMVASGERIFTSLVAGDSPYVSVSGDGSSVLRLENREARIEVSDSTNGFTKVVALRETTAGFAVGAGLSATSRALGVVELADASGEHVASLVLAGAGSLETRGEREIRARLHEGSELLFRTHAGLEAELSAAQRSMINQAIAAGLIAGHVAVQTQASATASAHALEQTSRTQAESLAVGAARAYGHLTSSVSASYGAVQVVTAATRERVDVTVASASEIGKTIIVSLDPDTIPGMAEGKATIRFDGELVAQASSYADILDANDDGGVAEYFVLAGDAGTQVLVSIPSFSVHTVTLEQQDARSASPIYLYATVFLGLLVVVETALLARARRGKNPVNARRP